MLESISVELSGLPRIFAFLPDNQLTESQNFVCKCIIAEGWEEPLTVFTGNEENSERDILLCLAPFLYSSQAILQMLKFQGKRIALQMEDPWAISSNVKNSHLFDLIYTNDCAGLFRYEDLQVGILPTNGLSEIHLASSNIQNLDIEYDLALIGYAYPSRQREISRLVPSLERYQKKLLLVGPEWNQYSCENIRVLNSVLPGLILPLLNKSCFVLCLEREINDVSGCYNGLAPIIPSRGYIEYASQAQPVFKRGQRDLNVFGPEALAYSQPNELIDILNSRTEPNYINYLPWTYRNRIGQVIAAAMTGLNPIRIN